MELTNILHPRLPQPPLTVTVPCSSQSQRQIRGVGSSSPNHRMGFVGTKIFRRVTTPLLPTLRTRNERQSCDKQASTSQPRFGSSSSSGIGLGPNLSGWVSSVVAFSNPAFWPARLRRATPTPPTRGPKLVETGQKQPRTVPHHI